MEETPAVTRERIRMALRRDIRPAVYGLTAPVQTTACHVHGEPIDVTAAEAADYTPFNVGDTWGAAWDTTWFRFTGAIPEDWRGEDVVLRINLGYNGMVGFGAEGLVWQDGSPVQGVNSKHDTVRITPKAEGGEAVDVLVEAAANPIVDLDARPGAAYNPDPGGAHLFRLDRAELAVCNRDMEALALDVEVLLDVYDHLPPDSARARRILKALAGAIKLDDPAAAREALAPTLATAAPHSEHQLFAVGNAHIDTAWLWPFRETVRKCARTFSTALRLMDEYPDYRFACSQPQQLAWIKTHYPELFQRLQEAAAKGQFELVGAMWVEADCNVPSGESLVRQILHGANFLEDHFGVTPDEVWLPDVFGYAASLPGIMRAAGIGRFLTQKLSWSTVNRIPHHTFWWEGIDGSRVLTHFPPADTYNGDFSLDQLAHNARSFKDSDVAGSSLYLFGYGDGGGGPTHELLEKASRLHDTEGAPKVALSTVEDFWLQAEADLTAAGHDAGEWVGELYLEFHRGTYTTSAMSKQQNRQLELLLREAELWCTTSSTPHDLDQAWKDLLLLQFHDVLPGTSISWVYEDSRRIYGDIRDQAQTAVDHGAAALLEGVDTRGFTNPVALLNAAPVDQAGVPALGYRVVEAEQAKPETPLLELAFDDVGRITSIYDTEADREVLAAPAALILFDDRPPHWDAWDIDASYMDTGETLPGERHGNVVTYRFGDSTITQTITVHGRRIDFATEVDWQERRKLLKAAFPVNVLARRATYEIQYGHVERPTHRNTSWDRARFEVCGHKWADLSEPGYGVALLNDCKYGYDVFGNTLRLSLLRAPQSPAPDIDRGVHRFTYSLFPHLGDLREAGVIDEAYRLNMPLRRLPLQPDEAGDKPAQWAPFSVDRPGVYIEAVKQAERSEDTVVRLYEGWGRHTTATLTTSLPFARVSRTDLLEKSRQAVEHPVVLDLKPFEIVTLVFERQPVAWGAEARPGSSAG